MADPLSIASGIAGLISLAAKVSLACYQYGCAVKGAPREVQALSNEVTNLAGVLTSVKALVEARGSTSSPDDLGKSSAKSDAPNDPPPLYEAAQHVDLEGLKAPVKNCYVILEAVEVKLRQASFDDDRRVQKVFRRLIWPFKLPETRDMLSKLERYKGTFISALTSTNVSISVQVLDVVQDIRGALAVDRWERQLEKQRADMEQIYRWLSPVNPAVAHHAAQNLHLEGTGKWLFHTPEWKDWLSGKSSLLWLRGIPGSGKTVLLLSLLEHCFAEPVEPGTALLYFYCDFRDQNSQKPETVLGTFLCQLCTQMREKTPEMMLLLQRHNQEGHGLTAPTYQELEDTFVLALERSKSVTIVVDALDELHRKTELVRLLSKLPTSASCPTKVLVSSRDEYDIREELKRNKHESIIVEAISGDIDSFVLSSIEGNKRLRRLQPGLQDDIRTSLRERACGMFRWVALQVQSLGALRTDRDIRQALDTLPKDINETYDRICNNIQESDRAVASRALLCLAQAARPLLLSEVSEAALIDVDTMEIDAETRWYPEDLLEVLGSLIIHDPSDNVTVLAHHSVKEYLTSDQCKLNAPQFHVSVGQSEAWMARITLKYLLMKDFADGAVDRPELLLERFNAYPFLRYAARYWPLHARGLLCDSPELLSLSCTLLHPARTPNFWSWIEAVITQGYFWFTPKPERPNELLAPTSFQRYPKTLTPLYYAASYGLYEVVEHLVEAGVDVNKRGGRFGGTALHAALFRHEHAVARLLLDHKARTDVKDNNGATVEGTYMQGAGSSVFSGLPPSQVPEFFDQLRKSLKQRLPACYHDAIDSKEKLSRFGHGN